MIENDPAHKITDRPNGKASFDENLHALLERKRTLMRDALMPPEEQPDELADMLRDSLA